MVQAVPGASEASYCHVWASSSCKSLCWMIWEHMSLSEDAAGAGCGYRAGNKDWAVNGVAWGKGVTST